MTTPAPAKTQKQKRRDVLIARVTITIPLTTDLPESYAQAVKAIGEIKDIMPDGTTIKTDTNLGKA